MSVPKECAYVIPNSSAKQCEWHSHAGPAPLVFLLFQFHAVSTLYSYWTAWSQLWQYVHCTVIVLLGPSCYSIYIVQLLNYRVPAVRVYTLYNYWSARSQLWQYVHYTVIVLQGPSCEGGVCILYSYFTAGSQLWRRCMYIIQLLYCRVPAVREVYVQNLVSIKEDASRNTINSNSNKISIFYRPTD